MIECNVIHQAFTAGVRQLLQLGSSCIYPRVAPQPMREDALPTGVLEPTNEPYAIAKIAGIRLCEGYNRQHGTDYRSVLPTNLYGPGDIFHPENSHVLPALIRRFHEASEDGRDEVVIWGTGMPRREFLHVDDMADAQGIAISGPATAIDCANVLLRAESDDQQLVAIGLENIVAIAMPDAVLIAHKDRTQDVKRAVTALQAKWVAQAETLPRDFCTWGWFESLVISTRFQVKRIHVNLGAALSLQSHHHRSEHWIVVEGTARVTIGEDVRLLSENQSVYIPLGAVHRMENPGKVPMVLIEVQTGSDLGEDDIIRYEDIYARG